MGKRRKANTTPVSLFPFLSVLACVIGVLTLLITAMALGQLDPEAIEQAEQYQEAKQQADAAKAQAERLTALVAEALAAQARIDQAMAQARELEQKKAALDTTKAEHASLTEEAERLKQQAPELNAELRRRKQEVAKLKVALEEKKGFKPQPKVRVQPSGTGVGFKPVFVECTAAGIVVHEGATPFKVPGRQMRTHKAWLALLDRVADDPKASVVFLLRDNGLGAYQVGRSVARSRYARNGKLPLVGHGELDLSLFKTNKRK